MARGTTPFLLPHERWLAGWILRSQRTHRTAAVVATEQKYGPQGVIWLDASLANVPFGFIPAVASLVPVLADQTGTSRIALYLLAVSSLFMVLAAVRFLQALGASREFRRERG